MSNEASFAIEGIRVSYVIDDEAATFTTREGKEVTANTVTIDASATVAGMDVTAFGKVDGNTECAIWWDINNYEGMPGWVPTPPRWFTDAAKGLIGGE